MKIAQFSPWSESYPNLDNLSPPQLARMHKKLKDIADSTFMGMGVDDLARMEAQEKRYSPAPATHSAAVDSGQPAWQRLISMIKPIPGYRLNA